MFKNIIRFVVVGWIVSMVAGAVAALQAKRRIGPNTMESADDIAASAIFGPLDYHSTATSLRGGTLELWYGGGVLDLRDATLAPEGATLKVKVVFGGGQVLVPASWKVVANVSGLGGIQDVREAKGYAVDAPTLTITGTVIAGGFAVQSELDEGAAKFVEGMKTARATIDDTVESAKTSIGGAVESAKSAVTDATTGATEAASDAADAASDATSVAADAASDATERIETAATDLLETEPDTEMSPTS
ncbi:MAG TPA: hypothetical protein VF119_03485 [Candidatus Limnocylindrales bacterium]